MKRLVLCAVLLCFSWNIFGVVPRSSGETGYIEKPRIKIVTSPNIPPGYTLVLRGLEWISWTNESEVSCHILFPSGMTTYSIECEGVDYSIEGDLNTMPPGRGKEYIIRIKNKE